jgi:lysophospholipase L1-like esterase
MPLGNSITYGVGSSPAGGFRDDLYNLLVDGGYSFDFVGSLNTGSGFDADHEGHPGFASDEIDKDISLWVGLSDPDVVLYHIGTNDVSRTRDPQNVQDDISSTLETIWAYDSSIWVILSKIIPRVDSFDDQNTTILNSYIEALAASKQAEGKLIRLVDHNSAFKANPNWAVDYMSDAKHPNNAGYRVMAQVYYASLTNILGNDDIITPLDPQLVTNHSVEISGLAQNTQYSYRVMSKDASGNLATSDILTFMTPLSGNINAGFSSGSDGFVYVDSPNYPEFASGSVSTNGNPGGALELVLGGVDNTIYDDGNENGWSISFAGGGTITITGEYYLLVSSPFESDEFGEVRLRFDGQLYGTNGNNYLAQLTGDDNNQSQDRVTGWTPFSLTLTNQSNATHVLQLSGYNNKKTRENEVVVVRFDNIQVTSTQGALASLASMQQNKVESFGALATETFENEIMGNYPNPFNPSTKIRFSLEQDSFVQVIIYNIQGREVKRLFGGQKSRGITTVEWDGKDAHGQLVATGVYILQIKTRNWSKSHRMFLLK